MTIKNGVIREQFTAYDCGYYPEINNAEYLEYETKKTAYDLLYTIINYIAMFEIEI